jgi:transposase
MRGKTVDKTAEGYKLETIERKRIEKRRRESRDSRIHRRLSALLWLGKGYSVQEVAELLDVCHRTVRDWLALYKEQGLDGLCSLDYKGDPG